MISISICKPVTRRRLHDALWGAVGLALLAAGWSAIHAAAGPFVLPSLVDTATALLRLIRSGAAAQALGATLIHALGGILIGASVGVIFGGIGGLIRPLGAMLTPMATAILGVPPIAWVVLSLLWFGPGALGPLFTVSITLAPVLFAAALVGVRARDPLLAEMALAFRLPWWVRLRCLAAPQLAVHLAPALSTAFALAWKVALTAEVLGDGSGIGGRFATARAYLDLPEAMAWVVLVVGFLLLTERLALGRLRRWIAQARTGSAVAAPAAPARCVGIGALRKDPPC